ncbi:MAG: SDR family oxidoreductase [Chloroflexi bacterium]|nr:SDR family oxidoreductase [Chloroflexota bacterium]
MPNPLLALEGKVAIVTGSGQGMGRGIASMLARAGACPVIVDLVAERANAVAKEVEALGVHSLALHADVRKPAEVQRIVDATVQKFGRLDIGVSNVGGLGGQKMSTVLDSDESFWDSVVELNLRATYLCDRAFAKAMIAAGNGGAIVNIASISGLRASVRLSPYGAAKAGVMHLTQTLAMELAPHRIRVNCIAPASVDTPDTFEHQPPEQKAAAAKHIPIGRLGRPEDIGGVVLMLVSPLTAYVTGQTVLADGGLSCTTARPPSSG